MDVDDSKGKRLFVAGLENGRWKWWICKAGRWTKSIPGFLKPQGIAHVAALNKLFVASRRRRDGARVPRADTLELLDATKLDLGQIAWRYDAGNARFV